MKGNKELLVVMASFSWLVVLTLCIGSTNSGFLITLLLIVLLLPHTKFSLFTAVKIILMKQLLSSYHKYPAACNKTRAKLVLLHRLDSFLISAEGIWTTALERKGWSGWELAVPFCFHSCTLDRSGSKSCLHFW